MSPKIIDPAVTTYRISEQILKELRKFTDETTIRIDSQYSFRTPDHVTGEELSTVITRLLSQTTEDIQKSDEGRQYVNAFGIRFFPKRWLVQDSPTVDFSECGDYFYYEYQGLDEVPLVINEALKLGYTLVRSGIGTNGIIEMVRPPRTTL